MHLELAWFVLNVSLVGFIVYAIVHPQATKRAVRELIEQVCQLWKASRPLRAKTLKDCVASCTQAERPRTVRYPECKSPCRRPKTVDSDGFACLNASCVYLLERDATKHALISDGRRGTDHTIQLWRCQASDTKDGW